MVENSNSADESDRDRGLITSENRAFLRGETEYAHEQSAINARRRIRERVRNSVLDFSIVFEHLSEDDLRAVVEEVKEEDFSHSGGPQPERTFGQGMVDMVAFAILCADELGTDFETLAGAAIRRYAERMDTQLENVDVNIEVDYRDIFTNTDRIERKFESREKGLTTAELGLLMEKGKIDERQALEYRAETAPEVDDADDETDENS